MDTDNNNNYREICIPFKKELFNNEFKKDPSIWFCIKHRDNTYSFISNINNKPLASVDNNDMRNLSLFNHKQDKTLYSNKVFNIHKNIIENNREFYKKMPKFLLKHNYNKYYSIHNSDNIDFVVSVFNNKSNYNLGQQKYKKDIKKINKIGNGNLWLIQNAAISFMNKNLINDSYLFNNDLGFYLCSKKVEYDSNDIDYNNSSYTTLDNIIKQNKLNTSIGGLSQINHKLKYVIDNDKYKLKYNKIYITI